MDCPPYEELSAFVDGEVSEDDSRRIHAHLESCRACAEEVAQLCAMSSALRTTPSMPESDKWKSEWRERIDGRDWWARWHVYRIAGVAAAVILFIGSIAMVLYADRAAPTPTVVKRVQANGIVYEVSTDKVRYAWGEPVFVQVKVSSLDKERGTPIASELPGWWVQVTRAGTPTWDSRRHLTLAQRDLVATLEPGRSRGISSAWDQEDDAGRPVPAGQYEVVVRMGDPPVELARIPIEVRPGGE